MLIMLSKKKKMNIYCIFIVKWKLYAENLSALTPENILV